MRKQCAVCSASFEAKRSTAKYCSKRCNVRAARQPKPDIAGAVRAALTPLANATLAELSQAGREGSASGVAALSLALRIDVGTAETGSSLASMVREHRAAMADALAAAEPAQDRVEDELRAARDRRRALAG